MNKPAKFTFFFLLLIFFYFYFFFLFKFSPHSISLKIVFMLGSGLLFVVVVVELEWFIMLLVFSVVMDVVVEEGFGLGVMASERKLFNKAISCGFLELGVRFMVAAEELVSEVMVHLEPASEVFDESSAGSGETSLEDMLELLDEKTVLLLDCLARCSGSTLSSSSSLLPSLITSSLSLPLSSSVVEPVLNILGRVFLDRVF